MNLALFDLDNTLLNGDSDFEWSQFLVEQGVLDRELFEAKNIAFYEQYKAGTLNITEFLDFQLKPLSRHAHKVLDEWHEEFMRRKVRPMIGAKARSLVDKHRSAGDVCVIVTATNSFVTAPIAREFGVDNLIATDPEEKDGEFTGRSQECRVFARARCCAWKAGWQNVAGTGGVSMNRGFTAIP